MKRIFGLLTCLLSISLLAACGTQGQISCPPAEDDRPGHTVVNEPSGTTDDITCADPPVNAMFRIVDGAEDGSLLLAGLDGGAGDVYRLSSTREGLNIFLDGEKADASALEDGMPILVTWDGTIMETYPAQLSGVTAIEAWSVGNKENPGGSYYDLCGLYLEVLNDLWEKDSGLNGGAELVSVDLSQAPGGLTESEKSAIAHRFGELHGVTALEATLDELKQQGCLSQFGDGITDAVTYTWENGVYFSITPDETDQVEQYSLPVLKFDAHKWRSPLGAYWLSDCSCVWPEFGTWTEYNIGAEMIS